MEKMWAGRFSKALDSTADDFNSSLRVDCRMYREDIEGSMAHAAMLGAQGIISKEDADAIISALGDILDDLDSGKLDFSGGGEDIHMFVEAELTKRIGKAAAHCAEPKRSGRARHPSLPSPRGRRNIRAAPLAHVPALPNRARQCVRNNAGIHSPSARSARNLRSSHDGLRDDV